MGKSGYIWARLLYSGKTCCSRAKVLLFGQKWFYSGKSGSIRAKVAVFGQNACIRAKVVVFVQKWLYSGKMVVLKLK